ncbi:HTH domain-containing protein [Halomicroarcula sp. GCM10025709]|uniref:HTH domain-containing protein n=1 Tax=Halomicroarcula sp. GCM10025709 TaxID=3252669 RepID=UPI003619B405
MSRNTACRTVRQRVPADTVPKAPGGGRGGPRRAARRGAVDETTTTTWAKRVPIEDCGARTERARYNEFAAWARQAGATLAPFFDTRLCYSMQTGEKREELVMPAMCVAVYEDGDLTRVAPATGDDGPTSIEDCLTDLAAHAETAQGERRPPRRLTDYVRIVHRYGYAFDRRRTLKVRCTIP